MKLRYTILRLDWYARMFLAWMGLTENVAFCRLCGRMVEPERRWLQHHLKHYHPEAFLETPEGQNESQGAK